MEPNVPFFPFFPSSFSTSEKDKSKFDVRAKDFRWSLNAENTDHQRCWTPGTWSQRPDVFQQTMDVLQGSTSNLIEKKKRRNVYNYTEKHILKQNFYSSNGLATHRLS